MGQRELARAGFQDHLVMTASITLRATFMFPNYSTPTAFCQAPSGKKTGKSRGFRAVRAGACGSWRVICAPFSRLIAELRPLVTKRSTSLRNHVGRFRGPAGHGHPGLAGYRGHVRPFPQKYPANDVPGKFGQANTQIIFRQIPHKPAGLSMGSLHTGSPCISDLP